MSKRSSSLPQRQVDDDLWELVELIPEPHRARKPGGRPWAPDRQVLEGILFVLTTGRRWRDLVASTPPISTSTPTST